MDPRLVGEMSFGIAPLLIAGAVAGLMSAFGKHKQKGAQQKAEMEKAKLAEEAARAQWGQRETSRVGLLKSLQNTGGAHGPKVQALLQGLDPSMFQERAYAGPQAGTETGQSTLGDVLSGVGALGGAATDFYSQKAEAAKRESKQQQLLCAVYPSLPDCAQAGPSNAELGYDPQTAGAGL